MMPWDLTQPEFDAHQVLQDGDPPTLALGDSPDVSNDLAVLLQGAVGEIQTGAIDPSVDELFQDGRILGSGPDGGYDLGLTHLVLLILE